MNNTEESKKFSDELNRRFHQLMQWAMENWPDPSHPLSPADFTASRNEIDALGARLGQAGKNVPEPSEGGAQYVNVNPAPWP